MRARILHVRGWLVLFVEASLHCRYDDNVERYLDVYLKTPNLPKPKMAKALLARANARKACAEKLLAQAHKGVRQLPLNFFFFLC